MLSTINLNPDKITIAAVPFQLEDANFAVRKRRVVFGHKTGLGKTFITCLTLSKLSGLKKILIIGTLNSYITWRHSFKRWFNIDVTLMQGSGDPNWKELNKKGSIGVWFCTYATFRILMSQTLGRPSVCVLVCDELHKCLRKHNSTTTAAFKRIDSIYFFGCTATWASRGPQDLFPVLNYIDKRLFSSYWKFVNTWCFVSDASFGKEVFGVRNADKLKELLRNNYYVARTWKEVGKQFLGKDLQTEPVVRRIEKIEMSPRQTSMYMSMQDRMEAVSTRNFILAENSLDKLTKSLQIALSPRLIFNEPSDNVDIGGIVEYVVDKMLELDSVVIFIPFKGLSTITTEWAKALGYTKEVYSLHGQLTIDKVTTRIDRWKITGGTMFCTISYAQSIALDATDYAYFMGFDWDPNNNIQAEGRLRRLDSVWNNPCLCTYLIPSATEYEKVQDVVNGKVSNVRKVLAEYGL